jgi:glycine/serine hydroxymethyltransferase
MMQVADFIDTALKSRNDVAALAALRHQVTAFTSRFPLP